MEGKEAYLIAVVGGDGTLYVKEGKQYLLSISDKCHEYHYILRTLFQDVFKYKTDIRFIPQRNTFYTIVRNKSIVKHFMQFHPAGISKTLNCAVPSTIFEADIPTKKLHLGGWIDSEGSPKLQRQKNNKLPVSTDADRKR